jgi:hypothetical protein
MKKPTYYYLDKALHSYLRKTEHSDLNKFFDAKALVSGSYYQTMDKYEKELGLSISFGHVMNTDNDSVLKYTGSVQIYQYHLTHEFSSKSQLKLAEMVVEKLIDYLEFQPNGQ